MQSVCAWIELSAGDPGPFPFSPEFTLTDQSFQLLPPPRQQGLPNAVPTPVTSRGGQWDSHCSFPEQSLPFLSFIPSPEMTATGKLLTVSCIPASHSKPKNWKASRPKAGIDIFNHSVNPLILFDASTGLAVGKSAADRGPSTSRRVLYLLWPVQCRSLLWPFATSRQRGQLHSLPGPCELKHREHSPCSTVPPSHPLPICCCSTHCSFSCFIISFPLWSDTSLPCSWSKVETRVQPGWAAPEFTQTCHFPSLHVRQLHFFLFLPLSISPSTHTHTPLPSLRPLH